MDFAETTTYVRREGGHGVRTGLGDCRLLGLSRCREDLYTTELVRNIIAHRRHHMSPETQLYTVITLFAVLLLTFTLVVHHIDEVESTVIGLAVFSVIASNLLFWTLKVAFGLQNQLRTCIVLPV